MTRLIDSIEHVILVIFENRSFDHLLGWMSHPSYGGNTNVEGLRGPVDPVTRELTDPTYRNPALQQVFRPYFADVDTTYLTDLPHGRGEIETQMAFSKVDGAYSMQGFAESYYHNAPTLAGPFAEKPECLRMLAPSAAPMTAFLAKQFCVCDHWFTPIPTDTHPNRMMALAGYTQIETTGALEPDHEIIFDWADTHKIPWRVYSDEFSYMMCMRAGKVLPQRILGGTYRGFDDFAADYQNDPTFPAISLIEPSFLDDPFAEHPNDNHPPLAMGPGEAFLQKIYKALGGSTLAKERFKRTALIIYYDEHGGFFDHVPPLVFETPCGRLAHETQWPAFKTTGPRIPGLVVSPLVDASVYKNNLDHTSVLRFLAERFTPDKPFSKAVELRHSSATADLHSLSEAFTRQTPRSYVDAPSMAPFQLSPQLVGRPASTEGQKAFLAAREAAQALGGEED